MVETIIFFLPVVTLLPTVSEILFLCSVIILTFGSLRAALRFNECVAVHSFYETLFRFLALDEVGVTLLR